VAQCKIFFSSPYIISIPLSLSTSELGRQTCWVACLLVCVSGQNPIIEAERHIHGDGSMWFSMT
jgi:hypothetical protein